MIGCGCDINGGSECDFEISTVKKFDDSEEEDGVGKDMATLVKKFDDSFHYICSKFFGI